MKVGEELSSFTTKEYKVPLIDLSGTIWTVSAYGIDEITANLQHVDLQEVKNRFPDVEVSKLRRPEGRIDMLIGVDSCAIMPTVLRTVGNSQLLENQFGYCIRGSFEGTKTTEKQHTITAIRINHTNIEPHLNSIKIEPPKQTVNELEEFFRIESLGNNMRLQAR